MFRRLGVSGYRCESPSASDCITTDSISLQSNLNEYSQDSISLATLPMESFAECREMCFDSSRSEKFSQQRLVTEQEVAIIEGNICKKLNTIVNLLNDFTQDVMGLRENASDLLAELKNKVLPYLINLDYEMKFAECLLRYNIDMTNLSEDRIDWLLNFNKYQLEMRRVFSQLADVVYTDLEDCLELRLRGVIDRRPGSDTLENLLEMKRGMQRAVNLIKGPNRANA